MALYLGIFLVTHVPMEGLLGEGQPFSRCNCGFLGDVARSTTSRRRQTPGAAPGKLTGTVRVAVQGARAKEVSMEEFPVSSDLTLTVTAPGEPGSNPVGELVFPNARWWGLGSLAVFLPSAWAYRRVRAARRRRPTDLPTF